MLRRQRHFRAPFAALVAVDQDWRGVQRLVGVAARVASGERGRDVVEAPAARRMARHGEMQQRRDRDVLMKRLSHPVRREAHLRRRVPDLIDVAQERWGQVLGQSLEHHVLDHQPRPRVAGEGETKPFRRAHDGRPRALAVRIVASQAKNAAAGRETRRRKRAAYEPGTAGQEDLLHHPNSN
jgi:hypothetical protein